MWDYFGDTYFRLEGNIEVTFFNFTFDSFHVTGEEVRLYPTPKDAGTCLAVHVEDRVARYQRVPSRM